MARPLRVNRANGWYHAYARGLNRMDLYADERDRKHLLELIEEMVERYRVQMHTHVLIARVRGNRGSRIVTRHGDFGRPMAMWMARRFTGLTLGQIGDACGNRDYAATAMAIRRFQSRLENDKSLAGQTRELSQMLHVKMSPQ